MKLKVLLAVALSTVLLAIGSTTHSQAVGCYDVQMVYARGSGQEIGEDEWSQLDSQIYDRLAASSITYQSYELGSTTQYGYTYKAVSINPASTKLGAWASAGTSYIYGDSVRSGEDELVAHLVNIVTACPSSKIILGGYSQGAHVMGNAIRAMPKQVQDSIAFVALFGDPKLHLPEGEGIAPPACDGRNFSTWRRLVEDCRTDNGVLGARKPYVPQTMEGKVGLWCLEDDFVCGSSKNPWVTSGHEEYDRVGGPIDQAAQEIAEKLKTAFTYQSHLGEINTAPDVGKLPSANVDVVFVLDHTVDMQEDYPTYFLPKMRQLAKTLGPKARFGFDTYIGCWEHDWNSDKWTLGEMIANPEFWHYADWDGPGTWLTGNAAGYHVGLPFYDRELGCDPSWELGTHVQRAVYDFVQYPNFSPYHYTYWPEDSGQRIIIPVTNKIYEPENDTDTPLGVNGLYTQATNSPDVLIYPLVPDEVRDSFAALGNLDDTEVRLVDDDAIGDVILETYGTNPQVDARLINTDYQVVSGTTITFDASPTLVHDDTIATYEWDFDNDSAYDETTIGPTVSHTFTASPFDNAVSLKVTTEGGLSSVVSATVQVIDPAALSAVPAAPDQLMLNQQDDTSVEFSWQAVDDLSDKWLISVNDVQLGYLEKDKQSIIVSDIHTSEKTTFGVQALSSDYQASEVASLVWSQPTNGTAEFGVGAVSVKPDKVRRAGFGSTTMAVGSFATGSLTAPFSNNQLRVPLPQDRDKTIQQMQNYLPALVLGVLIVVSSILIRAWYKALRKS